MVSVELTDQDAELFKAFREHQSLMDQLPSAWKQVADFSRRLENGNYNLIVQDGLPIRIKNPIQGINIKLISII